MAWHGTDSGWMLSLPISYRCAGGGQNRAGGERVAKATILLLRRSGLILGGSCDTVWKGKE